MRAVWAATGTTAESSSLSSSTPELGNVSLGTFGRARSRSRETRGARGETGRRAGKVIHLVRHGRTEMNDYLRENHWADPDFVDPMMIDTRLTSVGETQALELREVARGLDPVPELIVSSPLRRALRTAELAFGEAGEDEVLGDVPRVVCALARERLFHGSDIGRLVSELSGEHADWDMSELGDGAWWYAPEGRDPFTTAELEPAETFEARMEEFVAWLEDRPEKSIAVVSHWGVCYSLTGDEFQNCELRSLDFASDVIAGNGSFGKFDVFLEKSIVGKVARALLNFMSKLF